MSAITLGSDEYRDRVYACWLGKNIGGTLGAPFESVKTFNGLTFYDPVPDEPLPNDDLDLQLVWLKLLEDNGAAVPTLPQFADHWLKYLRTYPYSEYGACLRNMENGLRPPVSGCFMNAFVDNMGSPIRSEIWACVAPGDPQLAAATAYRDALLDHAGGEGVHGEMFWAAVQSAAFVIRDPRELIRIGLAMIPLTSHVSRAIRETLWCYDNALNWAQAREHIAQRYSDPNPLGGRGYGHPSLAAPNHGFTIIGWLWGEDFADKLRKAVNCGYDTDCTGATLAALLGILGGTAGIPEKWRKPVGEGIVLHKFTGPFNHPKDLADLTDRTHAVARDFLRRYSDTVWFGESTGTGDDLLSLLHCNERAIEAAATYDIQSAVETDRDLEIVFHYGREPILHPGADMPVRVSLRKDDACVSGASVELSGPEPWRIRKLDDGHFTIRCDSPVSKDLATVHVRHEGSEYSAGFILLGRDDTPEHQWHVPMCPTCGGRVGACLCDGA